jgi:hypothetical protein
LTEKGKTERGEEKENRKKRGRSIVKPFPKTT